MTKLKNTESAQLCPIAPGCLLVKLFLLKFYNFESLKGPLKVKLETYTFKNYTYIYICTPFSLSKSVRECWRNNRERRRHWGRAIRFSKIFWFLLPGSQSSYFVSIKAWKKFLKMKTLDATLANFYSKNAKITPKLAFYIIKLAILRPGNF